MSNLPSITDAEILNFQAEAVDGLRAAYHEPDPVRAAALKAEHYSLLCDAYEALGFGLLVPVLPTPDQVIAARIRLARRRDAR